MNIDLSLRRALKLSLFATNLQEGIGEPGLKRTPPKTLILKLISGESK